MNAHPSKTVLEEKFFRIIEVEVGEKEGKKIYHKVVEANPTVSIFPITNKYEIYLIDQYRYFYGKKVLGAISGNIDKGETALVAAKRELEEETGLAATQWELLSQIELSRSVVNRKAYLYLARDITLGKAHPEDDEDITLVKIPLSEAVEKVFSGEITHAASIIGILMLDKLRKEKRL